MTYEFALAKGTVIQGGVMPGSDGERYQYRVDEVLGQGGFGITYKVSSRVKMGNIWLKERQSFAMKEHFVKGHCYRGADGVTMEYSKASASDVEDSLKDFLREGKRLAKICKGCANIVDVNEVFSANNTAYYIMEYIEGGDLRNYKGIDEKKAVGIICEVAKAIEHIHEQHILHLDIKPENIVIGKTPEGKEIPVLIDFGISRHFTDRGNLTTTHKDILASKGFAPQEQFAGISKFSPEVDVYALAATLFYLIVGREPKSAFERMPNDVEKALPSSLSDVTKSALVNALKVQAYERTQSVTEFVAQLKAEKVEVIEQPTETKYIKDELAVRTVIKGVHVDYQIVQVITKGDCYIEYKATRHVGGQYDGNATQKANFTIYEYFVRGKHQRKKDFKVEQKYLSEESLKDFLKMAEQKTGLELGTNNHVADNSHNHEIFKANGTYYIIVKDGSRIERPEPPHPEPPAPDPVPAFYRWMKIGAVIIGLLVVFAVWKNIPVTPESPTEPVPADTVVVVDSEEKEGTSPQSQQEKEPQSVVNPNVTKKEKQPVANQPETEVQPEETDEQMYNRAQQSGDWDTMNKLGNKDYTPACEALAEHFVKLQDFNSAYYWALKSSKGTRQKIINICAQYGHLKSIKYKEEHES